VKGVTSRKVGSLGYGHDGTTDSESALRDSARRSCPVLYPIVRGGYTPCSSGVDPASGHAGSRRREEPSLCSACDAAKRWGDNYRGSLCQAEAATGHGYRYSSVEWGITDPRCSSHLVG
jgi:hypothetical protein